MLNQLTTPMGGALHTPARPVTGLVSAQVRSAIPYLGVYVIQAPNLGPTVARLGSPSGHHPTGVRTIGGLVAGTSVLAFIPPLGDATIICSVPQTMGAAELACPDLLGDHLRAGLLADRAHTAFMEFGDQLPDFSSGSPIDALPGDGGLLSELGVGLWVGRSLAMLRATDACRVTAFYLDNLLRVEGYNLQTATAGGESTSWVADDGWSNVTIWTPNPLERLGVTAGKKAVKEQDGKLVQLEVYEEVGTHMLDLYQCIDLTGRLGNGHMRVMTQFEEGENKQDAPLKHYGVASVLETLGGTVLMAGQGSTMFGRSTSIRVPVMKKSPDQPAEKSQQLDQIPLPDVRTPVDAVFVERMLRAAERARAEEAMRKRPDAWEVQEPKTRVVTRALKPYSTPMAPVGDPVEIKTANGDMSILPGEAGVFTTPDGSLVLRDAYGSEIIMSGGNVTVTCPGDYIELPGRSAHLLAGKDVTVAANRHIELSASTGDLRAKAENNLTMLGANSGKGGVLIESRASDERALSSTGSDMKVGGLTLLARGGTAAIVGAGIRVSSLSDDVVINSAANMHEYAGTISVCARSDIHSMIAAEPGASPLNQMSIVTQNAGGISARADSYKVGTAAFVLSGAAGTVSSLSVAGQIKADGLSVKSAVNESLDGSALNGQTMSKDLVEAVKPARDQLVTAVKDDLQDQNSADHATMATKLGFGFLPSVEYGETLILQAAWQVQMGGPAWTEPVVKVTEGGAETMAWPGKDAWTGTSFMENPMAGVTVVGGTIEDLPYTAVAGAVKNYKTPTAKALQGNYKINKEK